MREQKRNLFPIGSWVRCPRNGALRYVTEHINSRYFKDDGEVSRKHPSNSCWYNNYELVEGKELDILRYIETDSNLSRIFDISLVEEMIEFSKNWKNDKRNK